MRYLDALSLLLVMVTVSGCGWHLRNFKQTSNECQIKVIVFDLSDPNGSLGRAIYNQLRINGIRVIKKSSLYQDIPKINILTSTLNKDIESILNNTLEYRMVMLAEISILIPNYGIYPIRVKVHRTFFSNPQTALAKNIEQQYFINEMYDKVAEELIRKLLKIQINRKSLNNIHQKFAPHH